MLANIKLEQHGFPFEVFSNEVADNFKSLSEHYSIPVEFLGTSALFTISALSGNMFTTELNGKIKNIIYALLVAPSGLGKSPAYNLLCGDILAPYEKMLYNQYSEELKQWTINKDAAKRGEFKEPKPFRRIRISNGGTVEGIMKHAQYTSAGFGLYYDEGGKMLASPNAYKKDTNSINFWNEIWNGKSFNELRADEDRERFIDNVSISVLAGMQLDRIGTYFTVDQIQSGIVARFIFSSSDYIPLNEEVDHFSEKRSVCDEWKDKITYLFKRGAYDFFKDDQPFVIPFDDEAKYLYNELSKKTIVKSNKLRFNKKAGDASEMMIAYDSKLYAYIGRFMIALSIYDNPKNPEISAKHVSGAEKLYNYFRKQAEKLFFRINNEQQTNLTENELLLLKSLPDTFTREQAINICDALSLNSNFFDISFLRKFSKGWIRKLGRGNYEKEF